MLRTLDDLFYTWRRTEINAEYKLRNTTCKRKSLGRVSGVFVFRTANAHRDDCAVPFPRRFRGYSDYLFVDAGEKPDFCIAFQVVSVLLRQQFKRSGNQWADAYSRVSPLRRSTSVFCRTQQTCSIFFIRIRKGRCQHAGRLFATFCRFEE